MKTYTLTTIFLLLTPASLIAATAIPDGSKNHPPTCGTCNPLSGQNSCDITTSCINTGKRFHCACRAGYKASKGYDWNKQFRLNMPNYEFLVFVPENTACNTLCDNPYGGIPTLCKEVKLRGDCPV
ncbi:putative adhesin [Xylogone sp. PMI_703]|nr:putative adhesin [Xylogone sp. PMI_703]